jgi:hypothetical protein
MKPARDLRKYASGTTVRLIAGGLGLFFIVGLALIHIIYGPNAAFLGFLCLLVGLAPIGLVAVFLALLEWLSKRG